MEEINYYPNEIARALLNNRTYFVGVIVPTVTSPFHGEVVEQIEYYLSQKNYKMLLCNSKNQMDRTVQRLRTKMQVQHSPWHL